MTGSGAAGQIRRDIAVLFVGERFDGPVDKEIDARDKLVAPGFIDTHVHSGHRASHRLISDIGRGDYFGQPFLEISVPRDETAPGVDCSCHTSVAPLVPVSAWK